MRLLLAVVVFLLVSMSSVAKGSGNTSAQTMHFPPGRIAFVRDGDLWLLEGGIERQVTHFGRVSSPRFSDTGRYVAFLQEGTLWLLDIVSGSLWQVEHQGTVVRPPAWSPTHDTLAFSTTREDVFTTHIGEPGPEKPFRLVQGWSFPAWSRDGTQLVVVQQEPSTREFSGTSRIAVMPGSGGRLQVILTERYPRDIACGPVGPMTDVKWSSNGEWLGFYRHGLYESSAADCNELLVLLVKGGTPISVGTGPANPEWFAWKPIGASLAFTDGVGRAAFEDKVVRVVTMPPILPFRSLTPAGYSDRDPAWSQDGRRLAITRSMSKWPRNMNQPAPEQAIWVVDVATGTAQRVLGSDGGQAPQWGTGNGLLWARRDKSKASLWYQDTPDRKPYPVVENFDMQDSFYGQVRLGSVFSWWLPHEAADP
jgi:dipeptidyl aminopeptidase/acylaminoacyl peptidase